MARNKTIADVKCPPYGGETQLKHIRAARRKMLRHLAKTGNAVTSATTDETAIRLFASTNGMEIPEGVEEKKWLMELYHSGSNVIICKDDTAFYASKEWRELRDWCFSFWGRRCLKCKDDDPECDMHVDHIKPKAKFPDLALDKDNVQPLCWLCNRTKSDRGEKDYRVLPDGFLTVPTSLRLSSGEIIDGFETNYVGNDGKYKRKEDGGVPACGPTVEISRKAMLSILILSNLNNPDVPHLPK